MLSNAIGSGSGGVGGAIGRRFGTESAKRIVQGQNARLRILKGCNTLADCVGSTLGPRGRNVIVEQVYGGPRITKDGVSVARSIDLEDPLEALGANLIKSVAQRANDSAGDGTTTATLLAREIYCGGCKAVAAGMKPMEVLKGMKLATETVTQWLKEHSRPVKSEEEIFNIARISANGDETIGRLLSDAMKRVGREGTITVNEGKTLEHSLHVVEGYEFDRGFVSPYFVTNAKSLKCEFENNPYVLIVDEKLSNVNALVPVLESVIAANSELLIIAEDVDTEALSLLLVNKLRGGLKVCAVRAPAFGDYRRRQLEDIAALVGATIVGRERGIAAFTPAHLGQVRKATVTKDSTVLIEGKADKTRLENQLDQLRTQLGDSEISEYERTRLSERLGKLSGGVAMINVGGASELEVSEAKDRVEDALHATRAAVESGILPGGGSALLFASQQLSQLRTENIDQDAGVKIIQNACAIPLKTIVNNAGLEGALIAGNLSADKSQGKPTYKFGDGFDALTGKYCDMFAAGIIDPTKVVLTSLTDSASVASLMCTTEAAIFTPKSAANANAANASNASSDLALDSMF